MGVLKALNTKMATNTRPIPVAAIIFLFLNKGTAAPWPAFLVVRPVFPELDYMPYSVAGLGGLEYGGLSRPCQR